MFHTHLVLWLLEDLREPRYDIQRPRPRKKTSLNALNDKNLDMDWSGVGDMKVTKARAKRLMMLLRPFMPSPSLSTFDWIFLSISSSVRVSTGSTELPSTCSSPCLRPWRGMRLALCDFTLDLLVCKQYNTFLSYNGCVKFCTICPRCLVASLAGRTFIGASSHYLAIR